MHFLRYPPPKFTKMFWAQFHDFCVQKRSCVPWSPGAFWRFSLCMLKKFWGHFLDFCVQKWPVCRWVQMHSGCSPLARFTVKSSGRSFTIYVSKKRSSLLMSSDAFWKFLPCQLGKKVVGAFSRFLPQKTKLFAVKFKRILEVLCLQGSQKKVPGAMSRFICP